MSRNDESGTLTGCVVDAGPSTTGSLNTLAAGPRAPIATLPMIVVCDVLVRVSWLRSV